MTSIYSLTINDYPFYIGRTDNVKQRYIQHKTKCFNQNRKEFTFKLYQFIRNQGITKETFYDKVKLNVLYENVPAIYSAIMEDYTMNNYKNHYDIQNQIQGIDYSICQHIKRRRTCKLCKGTNICEHNKERAICKPIWGGRSPTDAEFICIQSAASSDGLIPASCASFISFAIAIERFSSKYLREIESSRIANIAISFCCSIRLLRSSCARIIAE